MWICFLHFLWRSEEQSLQIVSLKEKQFGLGQVEQMLEIKFHVVSLCSIKLDTNIVIMWWQFLHCAPLSFASIIKFSCYS